MARNRGSFSLLRWLSLGLLFFATVLLILQLVRFSRIWANLPNGLTIAGIPVGQLDRQQAAQRLLEVFSYPVELQYNEAVIQLSPTTIGFELDLESMLAAAEQERTRIPFWEAFWNYLWDRPTNPANLPLISTYSEERLRNHLNNEIAKRYDQPPTPAMPIVGTVNFRSGTQGTALDVDRSIVLVENALRSTRQRVVFLPLQRTNPPRPTFQNLEVLIKQTILDLASYDGVIAVYLADLQTGQEIHLLYDRGDPVTMPPDVAFSASSTMKIPIMVSVFRRLGENPETEIPLNQEILKNLEDMIAQSINPASDWLMDNILERNTGALLVTRDMQRLGLENTFLAGYFYTGAPLLVRYNTPANQRTDVVTRPDPYSQSTAMEMGVLLQDIYHCAQRGGGTLTAVFPQEITQTECQLMISILEKDRIALLLQAGVPDGTLVAHKHGWITDTFGVIHDISDTAIIFTPGGNYVLSLFMYHPVQLVFEPMNKLVADISRAVYHFYNLPGQ